MAENSSSCKKNSTYQNVTKKLFWLQTCPPHPRPHSPTSQGVCGERGGGLQDPHPHPTSSNGDADRMAAAWWTPGTRCGISCERRLGLLSLAPSAAHACHFLLFLSLWARSHRVFGAKVAPHPGERDGIFFQGWRRQWRGYYWMYLTCLLVKSSSFTASTRTRVLVGFRLVLDGEGVLRPILIYFPSALDDDRYRSPILQWQYYFFLSINQ